MRGRFITGTNQGKCCLHCYRITVCWTLEIWNCGCRVYRKHGRLQVQPCTRDHCPVFGNLSARQNPVRVQMRIEKRV